MRSSSITSLNVTLNAGGKDVHEPRELTLIPIDILISRTEMLSISWTDIIYTATRASSVCQISPHKVSKRSAFILFGRCCEDKIKPLKPTSAHTSKRATMCNASPRRSVHQSQSDTHRLGRTYPGKKKGKSAVNPHARRPQTKPFGPAVRFRVRTLRATTHLENSN